MFSKKTRSRVTFKLAAQSTLISLTGFIITFGILIANIYIQYINEDSNFANQKLLKYWTLISHLTTFNVLESGVNIPTMRNEYLKDRDISGTEYGLRIENMDKHAVLFFYPSAWKQKGIAEVDFSLIPLDDTSTRLQTFENGRYRKTDFELYKIENQSYDIQIILSSAERNMFLLKITRSSAGILLLVIVVGYLISRGIVRRSLRPLHRINELAEQIIFQQTIDKRLPVGEGGEFIRLQQNINKMLDVIERQVNRLRDAAICLGHDIRTPLTRVLNYLELSRDEVEDEKEREKIQSCIQSLQTIQTIAKQVLDLSEIEAESVSIPHNKINLAMHLEGIIDMYKYIADDKGVFFVSAVDPACYVLIEEVRLKQLVGNLLDNAIKFTPEGKKVNLKIFQKLEKVLIEVQDEGIGIDLEDLSRIWQPSWKKNTAESRKKPGGAGFGLSIVQSIVQAYNGEVNLRSEPKAGTTITVFFPVTKL